VTGLACLGLLDGRSYWARAARLDDVSLSVLINKDKPVNAAVSGSPMPNAMLASIKASFRIDSISIMNGRLTYGERFGIGSAPAVLTCDSLQCLAKGIGNTAEHGDTVVIRAQGLLMNAGVMNVQMSLPIASTELSFQYSGSLSQVDLSAFNPFIEVSEHKRLKTGILHTAVFDVHVIAGRASGSVRAAYKDLKIVAIEDRTGSESGVGNTVVSFFANNIKLRTTNMEGHAGSIKIGAVDYTRKSDETFLEFAWFALRSGISDVVGF
jgi:hypothetical protein